MKLNCISIAQVDFQIRVVRSTFIFILFSIHYFAIFTPSPSFERPFDCVRVSCELCAACHSHSVCCLTCQKQKQNFGPVRVEVPFAMLLLREEERGKTAFSPNNNVY